MYVDDETNQLVVTPRTRDDISVMFRDHLADFLESKHRKSVAQQYSATLLSCSNVNIDFEPFSYARGYFHVRDDRLVYQLRFIETPDEDVARACALWRDGSFEDAVEKSLAAPPAPPKQQPKKKTSSQPAATERAGDGGRAPSSSSSSSSSSSYNRQGMFVSSEVRLPKSLDIIKLVSDMHAPALSYKMIISFGRQLFTFPRDPEFRARPFSKTLFRNLMGTHKMHMMFHPVISGTELQPLLDYLLEAGYTEVDMNNHEFSIHYNQVRMASGVVINQQAVVQAASSSSGGKGGGERRQGSSRRKTRPCMLTMISPYRDMCDVRLHTTAYHEENWGGLVRAVGETVSQDDATTVVWDGICPTFSSDGGVGAAGLTSLSYTVQRGDGEDDNDDARSFTTSAWEGSVCDPVDTASGARGSRTMFRRSTRRKKRWCYHCMDSKTTIIIMESEQVDSTGDETPSDVTYMEVTMFHDSWRTSSTRRRSAENAASMRETMIATLREARIIASFLVAKFPQEQ